MKKTYIVLAKRVKKQDAEIVERLPNKSIFFLHICVTSQKSNRI